MKQLILVRHGRAQWPDRAFDDFDRPLDPHGSDEAQHAARRLIELGFVPDYILSSAARRTRETATLLAHALGLSEPDLVCERSLYLGSCELLLSTVQGLAAAVGSALLVGHNPGISELARLLAPRATGSELATAGFCRMIFDAPDWGSVRASDAMDVVCA